MNRPSSFVNIDELQSQVDLETVFQFYGIDPGPVKQIGKEIRTACFLNCGKKEPTGDRAIAIDATSAVKRWKCHQYGCGKGGNLVTLCDLLKSGTNFDGRQPRGERFKEIRDDLRMMVEGVLAEDGPKKPPTLKETAAAEPERNVPLKDSPNERARTLTTLDERFLVEPDESMNGDAAAYVRKHPFLTPELCRENRCGYLPRPGGSKDRRGGTLQGMWVYGYLDENSDVLSWFGRNVRYERQHQQWIDGNREGREPSKFHFVKGFHRGLEIHGQHEWNDERVMDQIRDLGALLVVEGANDRLALKSLGVPAFALCSNVVTREQAKRLSQKAGEIGVPVGLMLDTDKEGMNGMRLSLEILAEYGPVQLAWSDRMFDGQFRNMQPEGLVGKQRRGRKSESD